MNIQFNQTAELKSTYNGSVRRAPREGLVARRKYILIGADILTLAIAIVAGWGLAEILKIRDLPITNNAIPQA